MMTARFSNLRRALFGLGATLTIGTAAATSYDTWAGLNGLTGASAEPTGNPDKDRLTNSLEFVFGTNPLKAETNYAMLPALEERGGRLCFVYRVSGQSVGGAQFRVLQSIDTKKWSVAPGEVELVATDGATRTYALEVPESARNVFYQLEVSVPFGTQSPITAQNPATSLGDSESLTAVTTITVGTNVGTGWSGLPSISEVVIRTEPPVVEGTTTPDITKYPSVVGTSLHSFTEWALNDYSVTAGPRAPLRSWMGWFLWGNGTPPPGISAGYPVTGTLSGAWDFFSYQWPAGSDREGGAWKPIRLDQQPLYANPLTVHYAWPPGQFGYVTKPLSFFNVDGGENEVFYWADKKIVRGVNISQTNPYFYQYADYENIPTAPTYWKESWFYSATVPLETTVVVPGNLKPDNLLAKGAWNDIGESNPQGLPRYQPFPYPVWDTTLPAKDQTPFNIQVDRVGDFDADLVWEGTQKNAASYSKNRYVRTPFNKPGQGNYMKMTVAQGSPFAWCETNNNRYVTFYNLIRLNTPGAIDNTNGTDARTVEGGPIPVDGVSNVYFVLLYGDHNNPNQWYQQVAPFYMDTARGGASTYLPGGFNPPGANRQHNYTYTAVFFRYGEGLKDGVEKVTIGPGGQGSTANNGTDAQGNPYFYLEFRNPGKNWFVVGEVPAMRYYADQAAVPLDSEDACRKAAIQWAKEMGKYAFNFPANGPGSKASQITYSVKNMYQCQTTYSMNLVNPYVAAGAENAQGMTAAPDLTVMALLPHQYQPITLGPDLTKASRPQVVWSPLQPGSYTKDFPIPSNAPKNANRTDASSPSRWNYWSMRGNLKTIISGKFTTTYPFQNFLPVMPPPDWTKKYSTNGVQYVTVTDVGTGNTNVVNPPNVTIEQPIGSGATFTVQLDPQGRVFEIQPADAGSGYPDGQPTQNVIAEFSPPPPDNPTDVPRANVFVTDGKVTKVEVAYNGSGGYTTPPTMTLKANPGTGAELKALLEPNTGRLLQIDVIKAGSGYPDGNPANGVTIKIDPPTTPPIARGGVQATAYAQIGSGGFLSIKMLNRGFGYSPTITLEQEGITDPAVIVPSFASGAQGAPLVTGPATVISAGAGFDASKPYTLTVNGTGTGATASIANPGTIYQFSQLALAPGFVSGGNYPTSGDLNADAANIRVDVAPPSGGAAQTAKLDNSHNDAVLPKDGVMPVVTDGGAGYTSAPTGSFVDDNGTTYTLDTNLVGGVVWNFTTMSPTTQPKITTPKPVSFSGGGTPTKSAAGMAYGLISVNPARVVSTGSTVSGYSKDVDVTFSGGEILTSGVTLPDIAFEFTADGKLDTDPAKLKILSPGTGWSSSGNFVIEGGRGYDAALLPVLDTTSKTIIGVKVLRGGSRYLSQVYAHAPGGAVFDVTVTDGVIKAVKVLNGGSGYAGPPTIVLSGSSSDPGVDPKGPKAQVSFQADGSGGIGNLNVSEAGSNYIPGSQTAATADTPRARVVFKGTPPFANPTALATGVIGKVVPTETEVQQGIYTGLIYNYANYASTNLAPFGGGFEGKSGPDGYGLGGGLSATSRFIGDLFNFQQFVAGSSGTGDQPDYAPAASQYDTLQIPTNAYSYAAQQANAPFLTLSGSLKLSVQSLQRTITRLFDSEIASNHPDANSNWQLDYFNLYDVNAGRVVVNPSGSNPVHSVVSTSANPPTPANAATSNPPWDKGSLWSGFGVSDQWNDQHYFYGYYLGAAALAGIFDGAWLPENSAAPSPLWADRTQMGTAIDQWLMTLAYDPDNAALNTALYKVAATDSTPAMTYQKFAFFDQWSGHGWATGVSPGKGDAVYTTPGEKTGRWGSWIDEGTGGAGYADENENSIFEGMQAWSAAVLWGGATDRKAVVDLGIYLMATEMAAGDVYFLDKNYNLGSKNNTFSWAPVTTIDSQQVPQNGGNLLQPRGTDYVSSSRDAYYVSPQFFDSDFAKYGGAASPGNSIVKKAANSMGNFFFAYPAGSKLIQAFPAAAWTMAISRNPDFMRRWAGAWMRSEWADVRGNTALYTAADWYSMAMTAALCGVPYNPGDTPYPMTGTAPNTPVLPHYVDRLWSEWVTMSSAPGQNVSTKPFTIPLSVLTFLLSLDKYGTPDWSYMAVITDVNGTEKDDTILYSATFSKVVGGNVETTFVLFNPGWNTRYAKFYRLGPTGARTVVASGDDPITVPAKRMIMVSKTFPIE